MVEVSVFRLVFANFILACIGVVLGIAALLGGYLWLNALTQQKPPPQAAIVTLEAVPPAEPLCPGNDINYDFSAIPLRVPIVPRVATTLWSVEKNERVSDTRFGDERVGVWTTLEPMLTRESYRIPMLDRWGKPIMPGRYELRVAILAETTAPSVFALPFRIRAGCQ